jgi:sugar O-acyltransferase (sialic acid O-acetyltransferase NeuD family)
MAPATTPLVIFGAGGLGREALAAIRARNAVAPRWDLLGFLDDRTELHGSTVDGVPVLGPTRWLRAGSATELGHPFGERKPTVVLAAGSPKRPLTRAVISAGLDPWLEYTTVVHPSASLAAGTSVGAGSILLAQVVTTAPIDIGRHVVAMPHVVFTHDDVIGDHATFAAGVKLAGGVRVGDGAYLGAGALVKEDVTIGAGAVVGMGAVVTRDVPGGEVWVGNPARSLRTTVDPVALELLGEHEPERLAWRT